MFNIVPETGIRYGIIPLHRLGEFAHEAFEAEYDQSCPECAALVHEDGTTPDEPSRHVLHRDGYTGRLDSSGDAWLFSSPYFTRAAFCSPCAPGACYLATPDEDGARAFCFGPEWFDDDQCPYPIYSVATGLLVQPGPDERTTIAHEVRREAVADGELE